MNADELSKRLRGAPDHGELPILFPGQVAVSISAQGRGIGSILMHHVFEKPCRIAEEAGCFAIVLDVMSDGGDEAFRRRQGWFRDIGFQPFAIPPARMFMSMKQVRTIAGEPAKAG
jgi:predicted N-acetyltransferase YhbS